MITTNQKDHWGVMLGSVHNVGAGGVLENGNINKEGVSTKHYAQWLNRTNRAIGIIDVHYSIRG